MGNDSNWVALFAWQKVVNEIYKFAIGDEDLLQKTGFLYSSPLIPLCLMKQKLRKELKLKSSLVLSKSINLNR